MHVQLSATDTATNHINNTYIYKVATQQYLSAFFTIISMSVIVIISSDIAANVTYQCQCY